MMMMMIGGVEYHLHIHIYTKLVSSMSFMLHVTYKGGYLSTTIIFYMYIYTHTNRVICYIELEYLGQMHYLFSIFD